MRDKVGVGADTAGSARASCAMSRESLGDPDLPVMDGCVFGVAVLEKLSRVQQTVSVE